MQNSKDKVVDQRNNNQLLRHSSLGTAAFILTLIGDFFLILGILLGILITVRGGDIDSGVYFFVALFWIFAIVSTVLAVVDLSKKESKKLFPILAIVFGIGLFVIILIIGLLVSLLAFSLYR